MVDFVYVRLTYYNFKYGVTVFCTGAEEGAVSESPKGKKTDSPAEKRGIGMHDNYCGHAAAKRMKVIDTSVDSLSALITTARYLDIILH